MENMEKRVWLPRYSRLRVLPWSEGGLKPGFGNLRLVALLIFIGLNLADVASTALGINLGLAEGNYLPSLVLSMGGAAVMYSFKMLVVLLVLAILIRLSSHYQRLWYALYTADAIMAIVVLGNLATLMEIKAL